MSYDHQTISAIVYMKFFGDHTSPHEVDGFKEYVGAIAPSNSRKFMKYYVNFTRLHFFVNYELSALTLLLSLLPLDNFSKSTRSIVKHVNNYNNYYYQNYLLAFHHYIYTVVR